MFIRKITRLTSIGRFIAAGISGGEYKRFTLVYGGNSRGKSTLCGVLRSLQRNDPKELLSRKTFGAKDPVEAQLLLDSRIASFTNGNWNAPSSEMLIFDGKFVSENVYAGEQIAVDQRRNAYKIAVGEQGVALAEEVDRLDKEIAAKQVDITTQRKVVQQHIPTGMSFDKFEKLPAIEKIETVTAETAGKLKAARESDVIAKRGQTRPVSIPVLAGDLEQILAAGLEGISRDATQLVNEQLAKHVFAEHGRDWIADGLRHPADDDECPFCGQHTEGIPLVDAYKGYFSEGYAKLRSDVELASSVLEKSFGEANRLRLGAAVKAIASDAGFWASYLGDLNLPQVSVALEVTMAQLHAAAATLLSVKHRDVLQAVAPDIPFGEAREAWLEVSHQLEALNGFVDDMNKQALALQAKAGLYDVVQLEGELVRLEATKIRYSGAVEKELQQYTQLIGGKQKLVDDKDRAKSALDAYDATVLTGYEDDINDFLVQFGASFELSKTTKNYIGGTPQSSYCLKFGHIEIDAAETGKDGAPSFATTLSSGDRSTLALAFFLAQAKRDGALNDKVVVYDDPFTSLDEFRREMTAKTIVRLGERAAQTIVMSHDKYFLDTVRSKVKNLGLAAIQIATSGGNSSISDWDIQREVKEGYLQAHMAVQEFASGLTNDAGAMRTALRPLLENYIRYRFPNQIPDGMWLGDMLGIIRGDPNHPLQAAYNDLDDINGYTAPFHHDANAAFNSDEVRTFAKRTLRIVGGN